MAKETAEKKLLNLIEKEDGKAQGGGPEQAADKPESAAEELAKSVKGGGLSGVSLPPFLTPLLGLLKGGGAGSGVQEIGLKQINTALVIGVIITGSLVGLSIMRGTKLANKQVRFTVDVPVADSAVNLLPSFVNVTHYLDVIARRNIFFPYETIKVEGNLEDAVSAVNQRIVERTSTFNLVGISWLDRAETATVMIEDSQSQITHFLKEGEDLRGVKIEKIYADRVVLSYQNETITLKL